MEVDLQALHPRRESPARPSVGKLYAGVVALFLAVYVLTAQRGPAWQDSGIFQWRILQFDLEGWMGLALSHPLLILLGKAFGSVPVGPLAWRLNLVSAVVGAVATANVAAAARRLAPSRREAAWLAGGLFGLAHTTWWLSTICESQAVLAALFTAEIHVLISLVRRPRVHLAVLLGGLNGLALTVHNLALLAAGVYVLVILALCWRRRLPWAALGLLALGWLVGAAGQIVMVAHFARGAGLGAAVHSALFGQRWQGAVLGGSLRAVAMGAGYVAYNFPNAGLPLAVVGLAALPRRAPRTLRWALAALGGVYLLFAVRYPVPDQFMFFLPFYAVVAVLAGVGLAAVPDGRRWGWLRPAALAAVLIGPAVYVAAPHVWKALGWPVPGRQDLPYRDAARYWLSPWKGREDSAGRFAREALRTAPDEAVLIADATSLHPLLWVQRVEQQGRRVRLVGMGEARPDALPPGTPNVFVVSDQPRYHPAWLDDVASFQRVGPGGILFRVTWREQAAAPGGR